MWNARQAVEVFHLLFLKQLGGRVDKNLWVLKGGCNLRFFLNSIRYSEDMDVDVRIITRETLRRNVNAILKAPAFGMILRAQKLAIAQFSEPKQTDTTQRWKVRLRLNETGQEIPTKLEFSRRGLVGDFAFEPVDGSLLHGYGLSPMLASHYTKETAFLQKVDALANRGETQARDVFDLKLLVDAGAAPSNRDSGQKSLFATACERAVSIRQEDFTAQVVAFLPQEWQEYYSSSQAWNALQETVVETLHRLAS
jgi:predicted nucleotidyltransferase component of viral defense system